MLHKFKIPFFLLILILHCLTVTGNTIIVALVSSSPSLHHPMFFFLSHLSLSDFILTTNIVPNMLHGILQGEIAMSFPACIIQFHFFSTVIASECLLLAVMSYDRYLAICKPLRYFSIMHNKLRLQLVIFCWILGFITTLAVVIMLSRLEFCGSNVIDHFFCDFAPILQLSCSDISALTLGQMLLSAPMTSFPFILIIVTYICIFIAILRIPSLSGRQKAFSTCSSHLAVVGAFYGSLISLYVVPSSGNSIFTKKVISLLYTVCTPLFNPIIYCLRNKELKEAFKKWLNTL
ncbi:olfactory receptor 11L1-like [Xenopus tropicalis]|nr:olfactory receptor 11L1-like [Xenopus tropicalis]